ncbi:unnamed protein product, partial [Ixodes pacificus]
QVERTPHEGADAAGRSARGNALDYVEAAVLVLSQVQVFHDVVGAEPGAVHEELVPESGRKPALQGPEPVVLADGVERVKHIAVVNSVATASLELALQLNTCLDHFQGIREKASTTRGQSAQQKFHAQERRQIKRYVG